MNDKSSSTAPLFFVTKSGLGFEEGVYSQEELKSLPQAARPFVISIAVAESLGYVTLDHTTGKTVNELSIYGARDPRTGKIVNYRGVSEGTAEDHPIIEDVEASAKKIGNVLRDTLQDLKQKKAEDSLKAKIEAKKKELSNTKE